MVDYVAEFNERLAKYDDGKIAISIRDFVVFYEALYQVCEEYCGAQEIEEVYYPVLEKHKTTMDLIERK